MKVYLLETWEPYDSTEILKGYLDPEKAYAERDRLAAERDSNGWSEGIPDRMYGVKEVEVEGD